MSKISLSRRKTRPVFIGQIGIGGANPIRIQSMTTSDTKDTVSLIREMKELVNAGCEIIRVTVPTQADCDNLVNIRREMVSQQIKAPLVADIHFTPTVAMKVVDFVEKVRINPGNFADKKLFKTFEIKDEDYQSELLRIEEKFAPLVEKCLQRGVSMRIGTNHGSLSDRIMNRYGDTPLGMVESALEFLRIAAKMNYHDIVLSMKASNPQVMVTAYRLLVKRMDAEGFDYPLHLGVTEAGEGEDARIKSAVGIGTLLEEGLGDTVRISLTEDSVYEIPVVGALIAPYNQRFYFDFFTDEKNAFAAKNSQPEFPLTYERRPTLETKISQNELGGSKTVRVWTDANSNNVHEIITARQVDTKFEGVEFSGTDFSPREIDACKAAGLMTAATVSRSDDANAFEHLDKIVFLFQNRASFSELNSLAEKCAARNQHLEIRWPGSFIRENGFADALKNLKKNISNAGFKNLSMSVSSSFLTQDMRTLAKTLDEISWPLPLHLFYEENERPLLLDSAVQIGSLLIDGIGDSVQINGTANPEQKLAALYGILQAARVRISKTEFIACPSCGRTQFHLQDVTAKIKARTSHLKGLKIAIMGCIVNGPGEMADADFGYVGTGVGKISLYVGKECVERNIAEANALDRLVGLIQEHGKWIDAS